MKTLRILKRIKRLSPKEERELGAKLNESRGGVEVICAYLEQEIVSIDNELGSVETLYNRPNPDRYVGVLLAKREANFKLLSLLQEEVTLDGDQPED